MERSPPASGRQQPCTGGGGDDDGGDDEDDDEDDDARSVGFARARVLGVALPNGGQVHRRRSGVLMQEGLVRKQVDVVEHEDVVVTGSCRPCSW